MRRTAILLIMLLIFSSYGCKKKAGLFAPVFTCKVDGERFKPQRNGDFKHNPLDDYVTDTSLSVVASMDIKGIYIRVSDKIGLKTIKYHSSHNSINSSQNVRMSYSNFTDTYYSDSLNTGTIEIKYIDYDKKRISGFFSFKAKHQFTNETVEVTDGKFNLRFD